MEAQNWLSCQFLKEQDLRAIHCSMQTDLAKPVLRGLPMKSAPSGSTCSTSRSIFLASVRLGDRFRRAGRKSEDWIKTKIALGKNVTEI